MPTVLSVGPYRLFFYAGIVMNLSIFMLNMMTKLLNSGLIQSGYKAAEDLAG